MSGSVEAIGGVVSVLIVMILTILMMVLVLVLCSKRKTRVFIICIHTYMCFVTSVFSSSATLYSTYFFTLHSELKLSYDPDPYKFN